MIKIDLDPKSIEMVLRRGNYDPKDEGHATYRGFSRAALLIERALKGNISGAYLNVRTGRLRTSVGSRIDVESGELTAVIGSGVRQGNRVKYAGIHEGGGTIVPRIKQWLTVPLDAAKTAAGAPRFSAQDVRHGRTKYTGSFIHNGIIFGVMRKSKKSSITPLFVLKQSVRIRASHYLSRTAQETLKDANKMVLDTIREDLSQ